MPDHLTLDQVDRIRQLCLDCPFAVLMAKLSPRISFCSRYRTDSLIFLSERCEKVRKCLE